MEMEIEMYKDLGNTIFIYYKTINVPCPIRWEQELNGWVNIEDYELGYDKVLTYKQLDQMLQNILDSF